MSSSRPFSIPSSPRPSLPRIDTDLPPYYGSPFERNNDIVPHPASSDEYSSSSASYSSASDSDDEHRHHHRHHRSRQKSPPGPNLSRQPPTYGTFADLEANVEPKENYRLTPPPRHDDSSPYRQDRVRSHKHDEDDDDDDDGQTDRYLYHDYGCCCPTCRRQTASHLMHMKRFLSPPPRRKYHHHHHHRVGSAASGRQLSQLLSQIKPPPPQPHHAPVVSTSSTGDARSKPRVRPWTLLAIFLVILVAVMVPAACLFGLRSHLQRRSDNKDPSVMLSVGG